MKTTDYKIYIILTPIETTWFCTFVYELKVGKRLAQIFSYSRCVYFKCKERFWRDYQSIILWWYHYPHFSLKYWFENHVLLTLFTNHEHFTNTVYALPILTWHHYNCKRFYLRICISDPSSQNYPIIKYLSQISVND